MNAYRSRHKAGSLRLLVGAVVLAAFIPALPSGVTPSAANEPPDLDSILKSYVKALGGKEAIEAIRTRTLTGEITHDFPGQEPKLLVLPVEVLSSTPDRWRLILKTSGGVQQMGSDGARGWTQDADRVLLDKRQLRSGFHTCMSSRPLWDH